MRNLTKTFIALSALALGGLAVAGPHGGPGGPGGPGGHGPGHAMIRAIHELDLTDAQRQSIREILEDGREERMDGRDEHRAFMEQIKAELLSDAPDVKRLHQLVDKQHAEQLSRAHDRMDDMLAVAAVLTPAQRVELSAKLDAMRDRMEERMDDRRERFRDGRGPRTGN
ncbi:MAG: periplasmic heavy metal sensor [Myxococcales bacterium]|nr:periplasmic heavy metal sensor [Myxococcales bacterium]MCB9693695.1 periplasmic heavy metal sensor [Alphaproteobacteria bacterium]